MPVDALQDGWHTQIERYGAAVTRLLNEIADSYLPEIDWHIVGREEDAIDAFSATREYRWRLVIDAGDRSYFSYDVEAFEQTNSLAFRVRFMPETERVPMTNDVEGDIATLGAVVHRAFAEGRAGTVRVERRERLSSTYKVTIQTVQGNIELHPIPFPGS